MQLAGIAALANAHRAGLTRDTDVAQS